MKKINLKKNYYCEMTKFYKNKKSKILYINPHSKDSKGGPNTYISNVMSNIDIKKIYKIYWISGLSNFKYFSNSKILSFFRIIYLLIKHSPDIIHIHGSLAYLLPVFLFKKVFFLKRIRLFYTFHTQPTLFSVDIFSGKLSILKNKEYTKIKIIVINFLLEQCEELITVSSSITNNLSSNFGMNVKNSLVIPSGAKILPKKIPNLYLKKNKIRTLNILSVGVMHYDWKVVGLPLLIKTIDNLRNIRKEIKFKLILIGDGFYFKQIKEYVYRNKFESFVSLTGRINDVSKYFEKTDIYCQLSVNEGCSHSILEAMSSSTPVIAADYAGNKSIIKSKKNGLLVKNNEEVITKAIIELIDNPELVNKICEKAHLNIKENNSWEVITGQHLDLYNKK